MPKNEEIKKTEAAIVISSKEENRITLQPMVERPYSQPEAGLDAALGEAYTSQGKINVHNKLLSTLKESKAELKDFADALQPEDVKWLMHVLAEEVSSERLSRHFNLEEKVSLGQDITRIMLGINKQHQEELGPEN